MSAPAYLTLPSKGAMIPAWIREYARAHDFGHSPENLSAPGFIKRQEIPMLAAHGDIAVRHQLLERVSDARRRSDALFNLVRPDAIYDRPISERHRIIFYVGHLEAFDWNLLHENVFGLKSFHPEFDRLFAFGIDPISGGLPSDQPSDWPALEAVRDYVTRIREALDERLAAAIQQPVAETSDGSSLDTLLNVAIEHRLMHLETLAYMLHQLPLDRKDRKDRKDKDRRDKDGKARPADRASLVTTPVTHRMIEIPAGVAKLGLMRGGDSFGWDNEYEAHAKHVPAFEIDQYKVTNGQYLDFIAAGGYENHAFWDGDDWDWKTAHGISHPVFWNKVSDRWFYRTMFEEQPLPVDWPVYVSHAEATAYARWAGKSLPTEEEWHRAAYGTTNGKERPYPWGEQAPSASFGNFDFERWDPTPVNAFPAGHSCFGVSGMLGNGWEWTSTAFAPFPGFEPFPFYRGYSADFFDGRHFAMKGGSAHTAACMLRSTFRNWFQAHYQFAYAGFRCVKH